MRGGIDNAAHIGGLISGIVIGYLFYPSLTKISREWKNATIVFICITTFALVFLIYDRVPNDIGMYEKKMEKFSSLESMALEFYSRDAATPKDELLEEIKDRGIYYFQQSINVVSEADKLDLPEELHAKNRRIIDYCNLRIICYKAIYKAIEEDTGKYESEIADYNKQIENILKELGAQL
jgi:rhomboid protease GluP